MGQKVDLESFVEAIHHLAECDAILSSTLENFGDKLPDLIKQDYIQKVKELRTFASKHMGMSEEQLTNILERGMRIVRSMRSQNPELN